MVSGKGFIFKMKWQTFKKIASLKWEVFPHPSHSPDLIRTDFRVFHSFEPFISSSIFRSKKEIKNNISKSFEDNLKFL